MQQIQNEAKEVIGKRELQISTDKYLRVEMIF